MEKLDLVFKINLNIKDKFFIFFNSLFKGKSTQVPQFLLENGYSNIEGPNPGLIAVLIFFILFYYLFLVFLNY